MATVYNRVYKTTALGFKQAVHLDYRVSVHSLRTPDGRLKLRSNPHTREQSRLISDKYNGADRRSHPWGSEVLLPSYYDLQWSRLESASYASFRRKLYQGSASLGVTLAGYKQSREMIVKRYKTLKLLSHSMVSRTFVREAIRDGKRLKPKDAASIHLEVVFGWMPLLEDIHKAATEVIQLAEGHAWIKSSARSNQTFTRFKDHPNFTERNPDQRTFGEFNLVHTRGAEVVVSNPNVWLAERAGLLNPVSVAWDLVPWSFVVNMFLNTGQLVNSITDFAGLNILNGWSCRKVRGVASVVIDPWDPYRDLYPGRHMYYTCNEKHTEVDTATTRPKLLFRIPDADWGKAAIAASLFEQKASPVLRLLNLTHRLRAR